MLMPFYILQMTDNGEFVSRGGDGIEYEILYSKAYRFSDFNTALDYAKSIDERLQNITIYQIWEKALQPTVLFSD